MKRAKKISRKEREKMERMAMRGEWRADQAGRCASF